VEKPQLFNKNPRTPDKTEKKTDLVKITAVETLLRSRPIAYAADLFTDDNNTSLCDVTSKFEALLHNASLHCYV